VLLKDEEIAWHVTHHEQQLLWHEHVAVIAAIDFHPRVDKDEVREVKLWDANERHKRSTKRRSGAQVVTNLNFDFPQVVRQHTLGVVEDITWVSFIIYSSF